MDEKARRKFDTQKILILCFYLESGTGKAWAWHKSAMFMPRGFSNKLILDSDWKTGALNPTGSKEDRQEHFSDLKESDGKRNGQRNIWKAQEIETAERIT